MDRSLTTTSSGHRLLRSLTVCLAAGLLLCAWMFLQWWDIDSYRDRAAHTRTATLALAQQQSSSARGLVIGVAQLLPHWRSLGLSVASIESATRQLRLQWVNGATTEQAAVQLVQRLHELHTGLERQSRGYDQRSRARLFWLLGLFSTCVVLTIGLLLVGYGRYRGTFRPQVFVGGTGALPGATDDVDHLLFATVPVPLVYSDNNGNIVAVNEAYERMTGYNRDDLLDRLLDFNLSGQQGADFLQTMRTELHDCGRWAGELWLRHENGEAFGDKVVRMRVQNNAGKPSGLLTVSLDPSNNDASKRLMLWQAHHDPLTKLPNRNLLDERLTRLLLSPERPGALISIDLDRFKDVNDSVGPARGDQVLIEAAYRLAMCAQESDTVARLGADHFVMVVENAGDVSRVERLARDVVSALREPYQQQDRQLFSSGSAGVVMFPRDGNTPGELIQKADAARAQVKQRGGNGAAFFEPEINTRAERRLEVETQLRTAINEDQLALHLQPILDLSRNAIVGAEALLRWQHPTLGFVSPAEFVPIAEGTRLIVELGNWVVQESGRIQAEWATEGLADLRISLNVSAAQLRDAGDIERFLELLDELDREQVTIELTESAIIEDAEGAAEFLQSISSRGCRVALDDFGTGFSSLGYLRDFRFDVLKIDKTFIDSLDDERDRGLVGSILSMGRSLGMASVAEGVETAEQLAQLRAMDCDYIQGYHFAKPLPRPEFMDFVRKHRLQSRASKARDQGKIKLA